MTESNYDFWLNEFRPDREPVMSRHFLSSSDSLGGLNDEGGVLC